MMLSSLPAVSCGCVHTVIVLWLHRSRVLLLRLWVSAPWLAGVPHLTPSTPSEHVVQPCHCWEVPFAAALGCPAAFQVWVFQFLQRNRLTILYQNQHFGLFIPLGEKILFLLQLEQSAALRLGRGQPQWSWRCWRSLEFAGLCRHSTSAWSH